MHSTEITAGRAFMDEAVHAAGDRVILGDCLDVARSLPTATFDLIYADPPFFTKRDLFGAARKSGANGQSRKRDGNESANSARETLKFTDRWLNAAGGGGGGGGGRNDRKEYLAWLEARILAMKPLLKPDGVFLLHLDWHAVHYAKVMCDEIFGDDNFQNELIWHYQTGGASKGRFSRKHDTILFYSNGRGGAGFYFDGKSIAIPRTPKAMKRAQCATGARIKATDTHKNPDDVLIIPALNPMATERTGYPTQKPLELLTRLITALCPPHGKVGDFFCGSGTTLVAAKVLHRGYFGCDQNPAAIALAQERLATTRTKRLNPEVKRHD